MSETLDEKVRRLLPGAQTQLAITWSDGIDTREYRVVRRGKVLATGVTEREAVDRALFLWGAQR